MNVDITNTDNTSPRSIDTVIKDIQNDPDLVPDTNSPNVFSYILTFFKIILLIGIIFFILYEINIQTNNSIVNFFKPSNKQQNNQQNNGTSNGMNDWLTSIKKKTNSYSNSFKNLFYSSLNYSPINNTSQEVPNSISSKINDLNNYQISNPSPDNASSNIQQKKGFCYVGDWNGKKLCTDMSQFDYCYSGKIYDTKNECMTTNQ